MKSSLVLIKSQNFPFPRSLSVYLLVCWNRLTTSLHKLLWKMVLLLFLLCIIAVVHSYVSIYFIENYFPLGRWWKEQKSLCFSCSQMLLFRYELEEMKAKSFLLLFKFYFWLNFSQKTLTWIFDFCESPSGFSLIFVWKIIIFCLLMLIVGLRIALNSGD